MPDMPDKGISRIKYNYLNLPDILEYEKYANEAVVVNTKYGAGGEKLEKENITTVTEINGYTTTKRISEYPNGFGQSVRHLQMEAQNP